jgi:hypothetical protein
MFITVYLLSSQMKLIKHHVKIGQAVSENVYPLEQNTNKYGAGQGSCLAPLLWVMTSTAILRILHQVSHKTKLQQQNGKDKHEKTSDTFVDDTSLVVTQAPCTTSIVTCQKITTSSRDLIQKAERALFVLDGALELTKFLWYIIHCLWDHIGISYLASSIESPETLSVTQGDNLNDRMKITRLEPSEPHRTICCYLNIPGECNKQLKVLAAKSIEYPTAVKHPRIGKLDTYIQYVVFLHPGIKFPLPVSSISNKKLSKMQQQLLVPVKQKMNFRRTLPNEILYGPRGLGDLKFSHCPTYQGMGHLEMIFGHLREHKLAGTSLQL